jgi:hypothetical protein
VKLQLAPVEIGELAEGVLVSRAGAGERLLGHRAILASALPLVRIPCSDTTGAQN